MSRLTHPPRAFTLVEMMITLTIVLLLASLLTAAINKAQYEAMLTICQTQQKALGSAVITYAGESNRLYPPRPGVLNDDSWQPSVLADLDANRSLNRDLTAGPGDPFASTFNLFDDRVALRDRIDINGGLNCAMVKKVDLEQVSGLTRQYASQAIWYSWRFVDDEGDARKGNFKLGDRFEWVDQNGNPISFSILAADWTGFNREDNVAISSHPDYYDGVLFLETRENALATWWREDLVTYSFWASTQTSWPGSIDRVFTYSDGSVRRMNRVHWRASSDPDETGLQAWQLRDDRTVRVPDRAKDVLTSSTHLPRGEH